MHRLLTNADWDADAVRIDVRAEHMGDPAGVLVVDETGFLKKGTKTPQGGPAVLRDRKWIENCQIGGALPARGGIGLSSTCPPRPGPRTGSRGPRAGRRGLGVHDQAGADDADARPDAGCRSPGRLGHR